MAENRQPYLMAENVGYALEPGTRLFEGIRLSLAAQDKIALVGANGIGKSTLLKILAGQLSPTQGTVTRNGTVYYLPQISRSQISRSQISPLPSLAREQSVLDFVMATADEWWNIEHFLQATFNTFLDLSLPLQSLSGGELTQLFLAVGLSRSPNCLLLDEPTNHLDYRALESLYQILDSFPGAFVVVSHQPFFLDRVAETTWELAQQKLQVYGGNFSHYRAQKQVAHESKLRSHETARKELKRAKATALREQKRAAQSSRGGRQKAANGGIPRIVAGNLQRKAEATAGRQKVKSDEAISVACDKVESTRIKTRKATRIQLESHRQEHRQKRRTLVELNGAELWVADRLLIEKIQLRVSSGDRLATIGPNGSGKSCFMQALLGYAGGHAVTFPQFRGQLKGNGIRLAEMKIVFLDQHYGWVDRQQTVLENMQRANPAISYQLLRQQLGHFLFFKDRVHERAAGLSGGEIARLAIAMMTLSEIDLLILDEPTNHLDIATVDQMVEALNAYRGALWVISHDFDFLSRINITHSWCIKETRLIPTAYLPQEKERYYDALSS